VRVAVLASGSGTILEAMLESAVPVCLVVADRPCRALEVAAAAGVEARLVDRRDYGGFSSSFDREGYTRAVRDALVGASVDLVAMAGFGTVLDAPVHEAFPERILNTHPALLPQFPGWHAVEDALAAGATETGCTVHIATVVMDSGPILAQERVRILEGDTVESLHERIKRVERRLYPATVRAVCRAIESGGGALGAAAPEASRTAGGEVRR
jgi:phosphoribosylglycinamide formyltransferase 1